MNRIKILYDIACKYSELPKITQFTIGCYFKVIDVNEFWMDTEKARDLIFLRCMKKDYVEFGRLVEAKREVNNVTTH